MKLKLLFASLVSSLILGLSFSYTKADIGPKPTLDIYIYENNIPRFDSLMKLTMLGCQRDFDERTWQYVGGCVWKEDSVYWFRGCKGGKCSFGYMLPDQFKISYKSNALTKEIVSNAVDRKEMHEVYKLNISNGKATLEHLYGSEEFSIIYFIEAFILNLILESFIVFLFIKIHKFNKSIYKPLIIGNLISLPIVWIGAIFRINLVILEILAILIESDVYRIWGKKQGLGFIKLFYLSILQNIFSLFIGGIILPLL